MDFLEENKEAIEQAIFSSRQPSSTPLASRPAAKFLRILTAVYISSWFTASARLDFDTTK